MEELDRLAREPNTVVVSCEQDLNMDYLVETIWKKLNLMRVYTKRRGELPDFDDGLIVRNGATIEHVCHAIHRSLAQSFRYALVWVRNVFPFLIRESSPVTGPILKMDCTTLFIGYFYQA